MRGTEAQQMPACAINKIHGTFRSWFASCVVCLQRRLRLVFMLEEIGVKMAAESHSVNSANSESVTVITSTQSDSLFRYCSHDSFPKPKSTLFFLFCPVENVSEYRKAFASYTCNGTEKH